MRLSDRAEDWIKTFLKHFDYFYSFFQHWKHFSFRVKSKGLELLVTKWKLNANEIFI